MAISVKPDTVKDTTSHAGLTRQTLHRSYVVSGIPVQEPAYLMVFAAQTATDAVTGVQVPALGSLLPGTTAMWCDRVNAEPLGSGTFRVTVQYRFELIPSGFSYSARTSMRHETFWVDALGNKTQINSDVNGQLFSPLNYVGVPASYPIPTHVFTLVESANPAPLRCAYAGAVNSAIYMGAAVGTLRMEDIQTDSKNLSQFRNVYSFSYDAAGWNRLAVQPGLDGRPVGGLSINTAGATTAGGLQGSGYAYFQMAKWVDFNTALVNLTAAINGKFSFT